jgi:hypothetical protein
MGCLAVNIKRFKRKTTWQILEEVDKLMAHEPSWTPFEWTYQYKENVKQVYTSKQQREKIRHG